MQHSRLAKLIFPQSDRYLMRRNVSRGTNFGWAFFQSRRADKTAVRLDSYFALSRSCSGLFWPLFAMKEMNYALHERVMRSKVPRVGDRCSKTASIALTRGTSIMIQVRTYKSKCIKLTGNMDNWLPN